LKYNLGGSSILVTPENTGAFRFAMRSFFSSMSPFTKSTDWGTVTIVGKYVKNIKVGDRIGWEPWRGSRVEVDGDICVEVFEYSVDFIGEDK